MCIRDSGRWARSFSDALHAAYEAFSHGSAHVVVKDAQKTSKFAIDDVHDGNESQAILLRIHGQTHKAGWRNVHTSTGEHVDHVLALDDLKDFQDATVAAIYAEAQTLEEAPPSLGILQEWWRVLQPGGAFFLTAPNLKVCLLYTSPSPRDLSTSRMPSSA